MITRRPTTLPVCALAAVATIAVASQVMASTPVYSEDFNSYNTDADLIGQVGWARALENSPSIATLPKGINLTPAVAKSLTADHGVSAARLKREPFNLPASGIFSYEFDVARDRSTPGTACVGFGSSTSKAPAYVGLFGGALHVRCENYREMFYLYIAADNATKFHPAPGNWYRIKVDIDLGSRTLVAVSVKDLSGGDSRISPSDFQPLFLGKGNDKGIADFFDTDPTTWNEVFVRTGEQDAEGSGWIDNISATVTPAAN